MLFSAVYTPSSTAQNATTYREYQVKAAFLLNFGDFVEWPQSVPQSQDKPLPICILGTDPFAGDIDQIAEKQRSIGRGVSIIRLPTERAANECQVLFINIADEERVRSILLRLRGRPILTVSDRARFIELGGMIQLNVKDARVRFAINQSAAKDSGLKISSKLLQLAEEVR